MPFPGLRLPWSARHPLALKLRRPASELYRSRLGRWRLPLRSQTRVTGLPRSMHSPSTSPQSSECRSVFGQPLDYADVCQAACAAAAENERDGCRVDGSVFHTLANVPAACGAISASGSATLARIALLAAARSASAAAQSRSVVTIGEPTVITISPRRGNHSPSRSSERVPARVTGMIGAPVCAATTKAPILNGSSPGACRKKYPQGRLRVVPRGQRL